MKELTREQKIQNVMDAMLEQIKKMVDNNCSMEQISQFQISQLQAVASIK